MTQKRNGSANAKATTNHEEIQQWVVERGGFPAVVKETHRKEASGILRIDFPGFSGQQSLERIQWDEFFKIFDGRRLAFLHQDETAGGETSRFFKFVERGREQRA